MPSAPRKRLVYAVKGAKHYLFLVVPKLNNTALPTAPERVDRFTYNPGSKWDGGSTVVPVSVACNGELAMCPEFSKSSFDSVSDAITTCGPFDLLEQYAACFGALLLDKMYVLVASKVETAMELPFGPIAHRVLETKWLAIAVPSVPKLHVGDRDVRRLHEFSSHSFHPGSYYCDEADLSLPFPFVSSSKTKGSPPELNCDWTHHLRQPFGAIGLDGACSVMIRGFIGEQRLGLEDGQLLRMQLIGRQNHLNPGPRYYGRGLNHANAAGNDHVYELVLWRYADEGSGAPPPATTTSPSKVPCTDVDGAHMNPSSEPVVVQTNDAEEAVGCLSPPLSPRRGRGHAVAVAAAASPAQRLRIEFARHLILRGTIPIHWTSEIPTGLGEAAVHFDQDPNKVTLGSVAYFQSVLKNLNTYASHDMAHAIPEATAAPGTVVGVRCISMLRQSSNPSEEALARHYVDAVRKAIAEVAKQVDSVAGNGSTPPPPFQASSGGQLELAHVDWLNLVKEYKNDMAVSIFWQNVVPFLIESCHAASSVTPSGDTLSVPSEVSPAVTPGASPALSPRSASPAGGFPATSGGAAAGSTPLITAGILSRSGALSITSLQTNFIRVNCADSLDRTNLGCFFTCLQVAMEMLRIMEVPTDAFIDSNPIPEASDDSSDTSDDDKAPPAPDALDLDEGSMMGISSPQRKNSALGVRSTNRFRQPFLRAWPDVRDPRKCPPAIVRALSELFVANGDTVAMMYTNSAALHSNMMRKMAGLKLAKANAVISAQRRYENVFEDRKKFRHLEVLLGRNIELHFPTLSAVYMLRPLPYAAWSSALVLSGVPTGTSRTDIDAALRDLWDCTVIPAVAPAVRLDSSAICMHILLEDAVTEEDALDKEGFLVSNNSVVFGDRLPDPLAAEAIEVDDESFCDLGACDGIAVVEFDEDTCRVVDVAGLLMAHAPNGSLTLARGGVVLKLSRYAYPLDRGDVKSLATSASDAVKKAAHSLRSGFKNLVRGLN